MKFSTGFDRLDNLVSGGFEPGDVVQIYGESGSGKTSLCLQMAVETAKNDKIAVFISTNQFSVKRFQQLCKGNEEKVGSNIIVFEPRDPDKLKSAMINAGVSAGKSDLGLVVIDSPTYYYGRSSGADGDFKKEIAEKLCYLKGVSKKEGFVIVFTNRVYTDINENKKIPVGKKIFADLSDYIIKLEKGNKRSIRIVKGNESKSEISFDINDSGLN